MGLVASGDVQEATAVRTEALRVRYGSREVLRGVSLEVRSRRTTALIGPSGAGHSTLLDALRNDSPPSAVVEGRIELLGHDLGDGDVDPLRLRQVVARLDQEPDPLPLSVMENVLFPWRLMTARGEQKRLAASVAEDALRRVGLWKRVGDRLDAPAASLSLADQQRLCLARLLPTRPELLLLDQPTSHLDPESVRTVEELIWELQSTTTILLVTRDLAQARRVSAECAFLCEGRILEQGATDAMFVTPRRQETADFIEGRIG